MIISAEMGEIFIRNGKYKTSVDIAKKYDKQHKNVLRDIRSIVKREANMIDEFIEGSYRGENGVIYQCYYLTKKGLKRLEDRYRYNCTTASLEKSFGQWLHVLLPALQIKMQFPILNYRIDFYIPELNIAIEYDENAHNYKTETDSIRQTEIEEELGCTFIRIKEDDEMDGIRALLLLIADITGESPTKFM